MMRLSGDVFKKSVSIVCESRSVCSIGLRVAATKSVQRRPTVKDSNVTPATPTAAAVSRMHVIGVKKASSSWVSDIRERERAEGVLTGFLSSPLVWCKQRGIDYFVKKY